ncbi:hypothetical protein PR048_000436 [Dryococelus australis]|uniref:Uncharacterized protein n=1 Tax=Dryococelus australis TaxID=614101 RepID=A0ABQ9IEQ9_9NEOP|nr:hypothetical protein PR048_000436 [Dryococelus australis]
MYATQWQTRARKSHGTQMGYMAGIDVTALQPSFVLLASVVGFFDSADLPWRSRLVRHRSEVREALGSNPGERLPGFPPCSRRSPETHRVVIRHAISAKGHAYTHLPRWGVFIFTTEQAAGVLDATRPECNNSFSNIGAALSKQRRRARVACLTSFSRFFKTAVACGEWKSILHCGKMFPLPPLAALLCFVWSMEAIMYTTRMHYDTRVCIVLRFHMGATQAIWGNSDCYYGYGERNPICWFMLPRRQLDVVRHRARPFGGLKYCGRLQYLRLFGNCHAACFLIAAAELRFRDLALVAPGMARSCWEWAKLVSRKQMARVYIHVISKKCRVQGREHSSTSVASSERSNRCITKHALLPIVDTSRIASDDICPQEHFCLSWSQESPHEIRNIRYIEQYRLFHRRKRLAMDRSRTRKLQHATRSSSSVANHVPSAGSKYCRKTHAHRGRTAKIARGENGNYAWEYRTEGSSHSKDVQNMVLGRTFRTENVYSPPALAGSRTGLCLRGRLTDWFMFAWPAHGLVYVAWPAHGLVYVAWPAHGLVYVCVAVLQKQANLPRRDNDERTFHWATDKIDIRFAGSRPLAHVEQHCVLYGVFERANRKMASATTDTNRRGVNVGCIELIFVCLGRKDIVEVEFQQNSTTVGSNRRRKRGDPRENSPTSGIGRHDSHMQESGSGAAGNRIHFALTGGEYSNHYSTAAPPTDWQMRSPNRTGTKRSLQLLPRDVTKECLRSARDVNLVLERTPEHAGVIECLASSNTPGTARICWQPGSTHWKRTAIPGTGDSPAAISTLASHQGEPGSIPGRATRFWQVGIVSDDAVGRRVFSGMYSFPLPFIKAPHIHSITYIGSQDPAVKSHPNLFTHYRAAPEWKGKGNGRSREKSADQRHRPARFQHAGERSNHYTTAAPHLDRESMLNEFIFDASKGEAASFGDSWLESGGAENRYGAAFLLIRRYATQEKTIPQFIRASTPSRSRARIQLRSQTDSWAVRTKHRDGVCQHTHTHTHRTRSLSQLLPECNCFKLENIEREAWSSLNTTHHRRSEGKPSQTANIFSTSYGTVGLTFVRCAWIAVTTRTSGSHTNADSFS